MLLPDEILKKLQCVQCGGYLSSGPIVINEKNEELCGRCFKILPDEIKTQCVREIGLEAVAEILTFPCRYNSQGCNHTFQWNTGDDHEINCRHQHSTLSSSSTVPETSVHTNRSNDIEVNVNCEKIYNTGLNNDGDKCKLNVNIVGREEKTLYLNNDNVKLGLELMLSLDVEPKIIYSYSFVEKLVHEPVYDTISNVFQSIKCANCQNSVLNSEIFHCGFGHTFCKLCNSDNCKICGVLPKSLSQRYCKNYKQGCKTLFETSELYKHETDCEFNNIQCPLCQFSDSLDFFISHFVQKHDCVKSNELIVPITKKDQDWYFVCHDRLFHCQYYNFGDNVEFIVNYIGSNDKATNYKYEVTLLTESKKITKSAKCLGWNETYLSKAVAFELDLRKNLQVRILIMYSSRNE